MMKYPTIEKVLAEIKKEWELLATSPDEAGIKKMIAKYWFAKETDINLIPNGDNTWKVENNKKVIDGFRVIQKGKRLRFEGQ